MHMSDDMQDNNQSKAKQWIEDNLRLIISIVIVIAIAGGIYSYSKRAEAPETVSDIQTQEQALIGEGNMEAKTVEENTPIEKKEEQTGEKKESEKTNQPQTSSVTADASQETESSFIEIAQKGEGLTHLARRALADSLEKNPDSQLSASHKIYIEDYLRKHTNHKGSVRISTKVEFSKDLIKEAIEKSKGLNERQLKNLEKYAKRVPSLR